MKRRSVHEDPLCCCEYQNQTGNTAHIVQCCCDCEALDLACDRLLTCQPISQKTLDDMFSTIEDRLRIPSCTGKGAVKLNLDVVFPLLILPIGIFLATLNSFMTITMLIGLPLTIMIFHRVWMKRKDKPRTKLFYIWGITSSVLMYIVFEFITIGFREILLWENLLLTTMFGLMLYALYHAKKDPGRIKRSNASVDEMNYKHKQEELQRQLSHKTEEEVLGGKIPPIGKFLVENFDMDRQGFEENVRQYEETHRGTVIEKDNVTWVDSRAHHLDGSVYIYCHDCRLDKPPRAGHCKVCNACIQQRDHHCVWIDNCIGAQNHRSFWIALLLFEISGIYGAHLTLTTVCTPSMYFDWILFPTDCRFVYSDFPNAISFVSACYTIIAVVGMGFVLLQQCTMISQNITSQECFTASHRGWGFCCVRNNLNNKGVIMNWLEFLTGRRKKAQKYGTLTV